MRYRGGGGFRVVSGQSTWYVVSKGCPCPCVVAAGVPLGFMAFRVVLRGPVWQLFKTYGTNTGISSYMKAFASVDKLLLLLWIHYTRTGLRSLALCVAV